MIADIHVYFENINNRISLSLKKNLDSRYGGIIIILLFAKFKAWHGIQIHEPIG